MPCPMSLSARLEALQESIIPVWVYDHDTFRVRWANQSAVELWRAANLNELLQRDLSEVSAATRTRLYNYLLSLRSGKRVVDDWTLYPRGKPTPMVLHGSGVGLPRG